MTFCELLNIVNAAASQLRYTYRKYRLIPAENAVAIAVREMRRRGYGTISVDWKHDSKTGTAYPVCLYRDTESGSFTYSLEV